VGHLKQARVPEGVYDSQYASNQPCNYEIRKQPAIKDINGLQERKVQPGDPHPLSQPQYTIGKVSTTSQEKTWFECLKLEAGSEIFNSPFNTHKLHPESPVGSG